MSQQWRFLFACLYVVLAFQGGAVFFGWLFGKDRHEVMLWMLVGFVAQEVASRYRKDHS